MDFDGFVEQKSAETFFSLSQVKVWVYGTLNFCVGFFFFPSVATFCISVGIYCIAHNLFHCVAVAAKTTEAV